jgi:hypothetical protein
MNKYKFLAYCSAGVDEDDVEIHTFEYPFEIFANDFQEAEGKLVKKYRDLLGFSPDNWILTK